MKPTLNTMILLHGGFTYQMLITLIVACLGAIAGFIGIHIYAIKSRYYKEEFKKFEITIKIPIYLGFLLLALFISLVTLYFFMFLVGWITTWFD